MREIHATGCILKLDLEHETRPGTESQGSIWNSNLSTKLALELSRTGSTKLEFAFALDFTDVSEFQGKKQDRIPVGCIPPAPSKLCDFATSLPTQTINIKTIGQSEVTLGTRLTVNCTVKMSGFYSRITIIYIFHVTCTCIGTSHFCTS